MDFLFLLQTMLGQATELISVVTESEGGTKIKELVMRYESLSIMGTSYLLIQAFQKVLPNMADHHVAARLKPLYPFALCAGMAFFPSFRLDNALWDENLMYGLMLGGIVAGGYKFIIQTLFGKDRRIRPYVDDPDIRKMIDEYLKAKETGQTKDKKKFMDHIKYLLS